MSIFGVILVRIFLAFSRIRNEYGEKRSISPYSVRMRENAGRMQTKITLNTDTLFTVLIITLAICFISEQLWVKFLLTLFRVGIFKAVQGWGGGGGKKVYLPIIYHTYPAMMNLAELYFTQRRTKKYMNQVTHHFSSADISIFSPKITKFCCIKKRRYRLSFDT